MKTDKKRNLDKNRKRERARSHYRQKELTNVKQRKVEKARSK